MNEPVLKALCCLVLNLYDSKFPGLPRHVTTDQILDASQTLQRFVNKPCPLCGRDKSVCEEKDCLEMEV